MPPQAALSPYSGIQQRPPSPTETAAWSRGGHGCRQLLPLPHLRRLGRRLVQRSSQPHACRQLAGCLPRLVGGVWVCAVLQQLLQRVANPLGIIVAHSIRIGAQQAVVQRGVASVVS